MAWTTPTDRTTGYVVTAADWNIVEDDLTFLYGDTSWTTVTGGIGYSNSWVDFGAPELTVAYRKIGTRVFLRGCMKSGTINTTAFTLPSGYRPTGTIQMPTTSNGAFGTVQITSAGVVNPNVGSNVSYFLDGVSFDTI